MACLLGITMHGGKMRTIPGLRACPDPSSRPAFSLKFVLQTGGDILICMTQDLRSRHRGHFGLVAGMIDEMNRAVARDAAL